MGFEVEIDNSVSKLARGRGYNRFFDYLDAAAEHGLNVHGTVAYYQVVNALGYFYKNGGLDRGIYDTVYRFVKGIYEPGGR